jgi:hypothetical protein
VRTQKENVKKWITVACWLREPGKKQKTKNLVFRFSMKDEKVLEKRKSVYLVERTRKKAKDEKPCLTAQPISLFFLKGMVIQTETKNPGIPHGDDTGCFQTRS